MEPQGGPCPPARPPAQAWCLVRPAACALAPGTKCSAQRPWLPGLRGSSEGQRGRGRQGESNAGGASARRQHKHSLSASSSFFQPALHSHSPGPEQGGSASQPGAARCRQGGRPPLGLCPQDPPEAPARGWPAHWETQPHTSRASHRSPPGPPTTWRWAASWLLCILLRTTQAPFQQWGGGKQRGFCAAQEAVCPPRGAPDSASYSRHLLPRVHAGQPQGYTLRCWLWTLGTNVAPRSFGEGRAWLSVQQRGWGMSVNTAHAETPTGLLASVWGGGRERQNIESINQ